MLEVDDGEVLDPKSDKESVSYKSNKEGNANTGTPFDKIGTANITQKGGPFSIKADDGWIVHLNMHGKGGSENGNKNGTNSSTAGMLGKVGTPVTATKPLLPAHTWNGALAPNPAASVFSAINEARCANLQD